MYNCKGERSVSCEWQCHVCMKVLPKETFLLKLTKENEALYSVNLTLMTSESFFVLKVKSPEVGDCTVRLKFGIL